MVSKVLYDLAHAYFLILSTQTTPAFFRFLKAPTCSLLGLLAFLHAVPIAKNALSPTTTHHWQPGQPLHYHKGLS